MLAGNVLASIRRLLFSHIFEINPTLDLRLSMNDYRIVDLNQCWGTVLNFAVGTPKRNTKGASSSASDEHTSNLPPAL